MVATQELHLHNFHIQRLSIHRSLYSLGEETFTASEGQEDIDTDDDDDDVDRTLTANTLSSVTEM